MRYVALSGAAAAALALGAVAMPAFEPSPGVRRMMSLRMNVNDGQPNLFEKLGALFGLEGHNNASILAGDERDLSTAEKDLMAFAGPILSQDASAIEDSLLTAVKGFLPTLGTITSVPAAAAATKAFITAQGGALLAQVESMAEAVWQAFVALAIHAVGLVVPPATA